MPVGFLICVIKSFSVDSQMRFRQLPSGKWQAQYMDGWKPDGRKNVKTWTRDTQRKALKAMQDYIKDKENGLLTGKEIAFADWAEECLAIFDFFLNLCHFVAPFPQQKHEQSQRFWVFC